MVSTKILNSRTVFTIEKKCFLSTKSAWFLKDHLTMKTGVMAAENVFKIETSYFAIAFHNNCFCFILIREFFQEYLKNLTDPTHLNGSLCELVVVAPLWCFIKMHILKYCFNKLCNTILQSIWLFISHISLAWFLISPLHIHSLSVIYNMWPWTTNPVLRITGIL